MLETFRKRDNPRDNARPPATPSPVRQSPLTPQVRINETKNEAASPEPLTNRPTPAETTTTAKMPEQPQPQTQTQPASQASTGGTARLIVGTEIKLKGAEINDCDTLIVEGQVDASMTSRVIEVAKTGLFRGKVQVDRAEIQGRFEGELTAHKHLLIRASGRVSGTIRYGSILIEEGGEISGDVAVSDSSAGLKARVATPPFDLGTLGNATTSSRESEVNRPASAAAATQR